MPTCPPNFKYIFSASGFYFDIDNKVKTITIKTLQPSGFHWNLVLVKINVENKLKH